MRLSEVYAKSYTSLSSVINICPDFVNAPLKLNMRALVTQKDYRF